MIPKLLSIDRTVVVPTCTRDGTLLACLDQLVEAISLADEQLTFLVVPHPHNQLNYLRFITHVYARAAQLGKPRMDIFVPRNIPNPQPTVTTSIEEMHTSMSHNPHNFVQIDSQGYTYGDGTADFLDKYAVVAVGGTFDRMHAGHRLLLTAATWAAKDVLRIGITADCLLSSKKHRNLIASFEDRSNAAVEFARRVKPTLSEISVTELCDPAGPSATEESIEALVVSNETEPGARGINNIRANSGLTPMSLIVVDLLETTVQHKLSSSALRDAEARGGNKYAGDG